MTMEADRHPKGGCFDVARCWRCWAEVAFNPGGFMDATVFKHGKDFEILWWAGPLHRCSDVEWIQKRTKKQMSVCPNNKTSYLIGKNMVNWYFQTNPCYTRSRMEQENIMMLLSFWAWLIARTCVFSKARRASSSIACSGLDQSLLHQSSSRSQPVLPQQFSLSSDFNQCWLTFLCFLFHWRVKVRPEIRSEWLVDVGCAPRPPRFGYRAHPVYTFGECET